MAGKLLRKSGKYSVRVIIDGTRKTIAVGTKSKSRADRAAERIQDLATSRELGEMPEKETKKWLSKQPQKIREKLAKLGLIELSAEDDRTSSTLSRFLTDYITKYGRAKKPTTVTTWKQCERLLLEFFPADTQIDSITPGDAEDFRNYLLTRSGDVGRARQAKPLSEPTTRRRCGCAKAFFAYAKAKRLIDTNPFETKKVPTTSPRTKQKRFVTPEMADSILNKLPNNDWQLLFALARWGGMRVPSEPMLLRWSDVDFDLQRITFRSPKTEHHDGKECREIPIFPELNEYLIHARESANANEIYVLPFIRRVSAAALRKPLITAIQKAGLEKWPKLWTTLRASRVTELRDTYPTHVVDSWIGHDDTIARKHYAQTLDVHFEHATNPKRSHFASSKNAQDAAPSTENPRNPANSSKQSQGEANKWAMRDSNTDRQTRGKPQLSIRAAQNAAHAAHN